MYSKSQPVQLVFIEKLLTPCLKLETLGTDLTTFINES